VNGLVPFETLKDESYRLGSYCRDNGNCFGTLEVRRRGGWERLRDEAWGWHSDCALDEVVRAALRIPTPTQTLIPTSRLAPQPHQDDVRSVATRILPRDGARRLNAHGRTYFAITYPGPSGPQTRLVSNFSSTKDVADCAVASCYIPYWAGPRLTTRCGVEVGWVGSGGARRQTKLRQPWRS
jgi:hypothetical protein